MNRSDFSEEIQKIVLDPGNQTDDGQIRPLHREKVAKEGFRVFYTAHPDVDNPSDINTLTKAEFFRPLGWFEFRVLHAMETYRKRRADFSKRPHWVD